MSGDICTTGDIRYVGRGEAVATRKAEMDGYQVRVTARDGEYFACTRDLRADRMNFVIVDGIVWQAGPG